MILRYRASLPGINGFARVYEVKGNTTLYSFHKQMRADMDFPQDQLVLFKAIDNEGNIRARYGMFDLGAGTIDSVTLWDTVRDGVQSFVYFYDTINKKSITLTYEGQVEITSGVTYPFLVESKGPNPVEFENGYVAFEDLPNDRKRMMVYGEDGELNDPDDEDMGLDDEDMDYDDEDAEPGDFADEDNET